MSHGGGGGEDGVSSEPNLTPLLDMVLQLVMFFMLVTNFVSDEMSDKIKLPIASQAKPLTAKDTNFMYVNVDKSGHILFPGKEPIIDESEIMFNMRNFVKVNRLNQDGKTPERVYDLVTVIIRADKDAKFRDLHKTMTAIKKVGFKHLQLRAELPGSK
ncbi:ExbD/TolR family protein [Zavarzinella formosa]|uniref:ExbD/TolR family protein n=1 Tax=Zavarzinella formosa TaxID=360055 RepID=UPI000360EC24|nr:biopolymer transporter ExbD [Zavarzinella formosa]